jgi:RIO-like serine/threonine protein kinase
MMRIATELSDEDVLVLRAVAEAWDHYQHLPAQAMHTLAMPAIRGIPGESVLGICGKLQSLGLIANPEQHAKALRNGSYPEGGGFVPLERAEAFLRAIADRG